MDGNGGERQPKDGERRSRGARGQTLIRAEVRAAVLAGAAPAAEAAARHSPIQIPAFSLQRSAKRRALRHSIGALNCGRCAEADPASPTAAVYLGERELWAPMGSCLLSSHCGCCGWGRQERLAEKTRFRQP